MLQRLVVSGVIVATGLLVGSAPAVAQSNIEVNAGIQFDFINPGARSLALGGAFTAIADDATSAFTNPAGLLEISRKEVSLEARFRNFQTPFTLRGHAFGTPTGNGTDTISGIEDGTSKDSTGAAAFASFVYPTAKWSIAGYRHELAHFKSQIQTEGVYVGTTPTRVLPVQGSLDLTVVDYGISGSYRISNQVSIGAGIAFYDFSSESATTRYSVAGTFGPATYTSPASNQTQFGDATGVGVNIGVLLKPSNKVQVGAVYRKGAAFDVQVTNSAPVINDTAKFRVPDVFSVGLMIRPTDPFRVAVDYTHVQYSQMTDDFVDLFNSLGSSANSYSVDDANEIHAGAEYFFAKSKVPVALRGGVWFDPAHAIRYNGPSETFQALFRERDDQVHYTVGAGFVVQQFELNAGVDLSDIVRSFSVSTVVRF